MLPGRLGQIAFPWALARQPVLLGGNSFLDRISSLQPLMNRRRANAKCSTSGGSIGIVHAIDRYRAHVALVLRRLLQRSRPPAIARLVVAVGVQSVDGVVQGRTLSHVRQEGDERSVPPLADTNAPPAIFRKVFVGGLFASRLHADPHAVGRASFATDFVAVLQSAVRISHCYLNSGSPLKCKLKGMLQ